MKSVCSARRVRVSVVLSMVCVFALLLLGSGSALAKSKSKHKHGSPRPAKNLPVVPGSQYLALGDSVTFGYMESSVVPAPNYADAASFLGYPELLGSELHLTVANAACSGETSSSLIDATAPSNGCENSPGGGPGYRTLFPLHGKYRGSQLDYAVSYLKT